MYGKADLVIVHIAAGMHGFVDVRTCKGFQANRRRLTVEQQRNSKEWTYYIAAEEIMWNYAPKMPAYIDELIQVLIPKLASCKNTYI